MATTWIQSVGFLPQLKGSELKSACPHKTALLADVVGIMAHVCIKHKVSHKCFLTSEDLLYHVYQGACAITVYHIDRISYYQQVFLHHSCPV